MRHHGLWDYHSRCSLSSRNDVQYVLKMGLKIKIFMSILFSQLNCLETGDKWWIKRGFIFTRKQDMGWWLRLMTRLLKLRWQDYEQNGIPMLQQIKGVETQPWNICWEAYDNDKKLAAKSLRRFRSKSWRDYAVFEETDETTQETGLRRQDNIGLDLPIDSWNRNEELSCRLL